MDHWGNTSRTVDCEVTADIKLGCTDSSMTQKHCCASTPSQAAQIYAFDVVKQPCIFRKFCLQKLTHSREKALSNPHRATTLNLL